MKTYLLLVCIFLAAKLDAQDFHFLHDTDSTAEAYLSIVPCDDGSYLALGSRINFTSGTREQIWINISPGGGIIQNKKIISSSDFWCFNNFPNLKKRTNGYVFPLSATFVSTNINKLYNFAGLVLLDNQFDTVLVKKYTDTSLYCDVLLDCAILPDGGFLLSGYRTSPDLLQASLLKGLLIRTDATCNLLWLHTYQKESGKDHIAGTLQPISNDRTVVGASIRSDAMVSSNDYYKHKPWFFVIDNATGTIVRDTVYSAPYAGAAQCYADFNGGFYHWGYSDSLYTTNPDDPENFPWHISRLDTNFNILWQTNLSYFEKLSNRTPSIVRQLQNGDYLMVGSAFPSSFIPFGWAARISSTGSVLWDNYYVSDSTYDGNLSDFVERQDGSIVLVGWATNDTIPQWHEQDAWIIGIDANGDILPHSTFAANAHTHSIDFSIYPNPNAGDLTIDIPADGIATVYDMSGKKLSTYSVRKGKNRIVLDDVSPGYFLLEYCTENGMRTARRFLKQ